MYVLERSLAIFLNSRILVLRYFIFCHFNYIET